MTVNKDEHERILLEHLNAWFVTSAPGGDVLYDYGDADPGPLQLSIPIGLDPQAAPLQGQEPSSQVGKCDKYCYKLIKLTSNIHKNGVLNNTFYVLGSRTTTKLYES